MCSGRILVRAIGLIPAALISLVIRSALAQQPQPPAPCKTTAECAQIAVALAKTTDTLVTQVGKLTEALDKIQSKNFAQVYEVAFSLSHETCDNPDPPLQSFSTVCTVHFSPPPDWSTNSVILGSSFSGPVSGKGVSPLLGYDCCILNMLSLTSSTAKILATHPTRGNWPNEIRADPNIRAWQWTGHLLVFYREAPQKSEK